MKKNSNGFEAVKIPFERFLTSIRKDKKNLGSRLSLVLTRGPGRIFQDFYPDDIFLPELCMQFLFHQNWQCFLLQEWHNNFSAYFLPLCFFESNSNELKLSSHFTFCFLQINGCCFRIFYRIGKNYFFYDGRQHGLCKKFHFTDKKNSGSLKIIVYIKKYKL